MAESFGGGTAGRKLAEYSLAVQGEGWMQKKLALPPIMAESHHRIVSE
jgi:hypothetical protein